MGFISPWRFDSSRPHCESPAIAGFSSFWPSVFHGRRLSFSASASRRSWLTPARLSSFGKYWRRRPPTNWYLERLGTRQAHTSSWQRGLNENTNGSLDGTRRTSRLTPHRTDATIAWAALDFGLHGSPRTGINSGIKLSATGGNTRSVNAPRNARTPLAASVSSDLITRRSRVRVPPPLLRKAPLRRGFSRCRTDARIRAGSSRASCGQRVLT